jgi:tetratricopeptide (TPR) repeat protein
MMRTMRHALPGLIGVLLIAGAALAADPDNGEELARNHFRTGVSYFDRGDYHHALEEFQRARAVQPRPELDFNIGRVYERMGDAAHAARYYQRYLDARPDSADAPATREAMTRLARRIGWLRLTGVAAGERVTVDDEETDDPRRIAVTEGAHIVVAQAPGRPARSAATRVSAGAEVVVALDERPPAPAPRRRGLYIGLGIAGAAIVVAAAVALGVALSQTTDYAADARAGCLAPCMVFTFR